MHSLNELDPLPKLGALVKAPEELTEAEKQDLRVMAFEKSHWYDVAHALNTAALDGYASHPYFCL